MSPVGTMVRSILGVPLVIVAVALAVFMTACGGEEEPGASGGVEKVTLSLDWLIGPAHVGPFVAKEKGWYRDAGLDVEIREGSGSTQAAQFVASGRATFGFMPPSALVTAVAAGAPLVMIANPTQRDLASVIVPKDGPIKRLVDLQGRSCSASSFSIINKEVGIAFDQLGLDWDSVRKVSLDPTAVMPSLIAGKVDADCDGIYNWIYYKNRGFETRPFFLADHGVNLMAAGYVATRKMIEEQPDIVEAFVRETLRGWRWAFANPREAAEIATELNPQSRYTTVEDKYEALKILPDHAHTENTEGKPLGWMSLEDWKKVVDTMVEYGLQDLSESKAPEPETLFTNQFFPK
jgi:NitT/TauT family transport system substrate-binding protein